MTVSAEPGGRQELGLFELKSGTRLAGFNPNVRFCTVFFGGAVSRCAVSHWAVSHWAVSRWSVSHWAVSHSVVYHRAVLFAERAFRACHLGYGPRGEASMSPAGTRNSSMGSVVLPRGAWRPSATRITPRPGINSDRSLARSSR